MMGWRDVNMSGS